MYVPPVPPPPSYATASALCAPKEKRETPNLASWAPKHEWPTSVPCFKDKLQRTPWAIVNFLWGWQMDVPEIRPEGFLWKASTLGSTENWWRWLILTLKGVKFQLALNVWLWKEKQMAVRCVQTWWFVDQKSIWQVLPANPKDPHVDLERLWLGGGPSMAGHHPLSASSWGIFTFLYPQPSITRRL